MGNVKRLNSNLWVIVQARMGSERFPGKVLEKLDGKEMIQHQIDTLKRLKERKTISDFIIATPNTDENFELWEFLEKNKIKYFKGSHKDVLDRYYQCAKNNNIKTIIRLCADTPLIKEWQIQQQIENFEKYRKFSYGNGCWIFSFEELEESWKNGKHEEDREHVVTRMFNSVDYPDDLERLNNFLKEKQSNKE